MIEGIFYTNEAVVEMIKRDIDKNYRSIRHYARENDISANYVCNIINGFVPASNRIAMIYGLVGERLFRIGLTDENK